MEPHSQRIAEVSSGLLRPDNPSTKITPSAPQLTNVRLTLSRVWNARTSRYLSLLEDLRGKVSEYMKNEYGVELSPPLADGILKSWSNAELSGLAFRSVLNMSIPIFISMSKTTACWTRSSNTQPAGYK